MYAAFVFTIHNAPCFEKYVLFMIIGTHNLNSYITYNSIPKNTLYGKFCTCRWLRYFEFEARGRSIILFKIYLIQFGLIRHNEASVIFFDTGKAHTKSRYVQAMMHQFLKLQKQNQNAIFSLKKLLHY